MVKKADDLRDFQAQQAAYLRGRHKMRQEEIGLVLGGLSQSHVSRLLARAERMGWLVTELRFVEAGIDDRALEQIRHLLEPQTLMQALEKLVNRVGGHVPHVAVFDSGGEGGSPAAMDMRRRRLGLAAAGRLDELLQNARKIGVAWGRTVSALIDGLAEQRRRARKADAMLLAPLCAELVDLPASDYSSSRLAERLCGILGEGASEPLSLAGVPAYVPRHYPKEKAEILWEYVRDSLSYRRIFASAKPLICELDCVLTSTGTTMVPVHGGTAGLLAAGGIDIDRLRSLVLGDIGGALVPKPDLGPEDAALVDELSRMWTGVDLKHFGAIAARARCCETRPGTVVIALGRDKAPVLLELIRGSLINALIIDRDLARDLERLAKTQAEQS